MALVIAPRHCLFNQFGYRQRHSIRHFSKPEWPRPRAIPRKKVAIYGTLGCSIVVGTYYHHYQSSRSNLVAPGVEPLVKDYFVTEDIPECKVTRSIDNSAEKLKIKFTLYQYQTCPFCCKTRAFLDYFGINYDVVEVNSITKKQVSISMQCSHL